jgi:dipeptidyl-peptidase-4
MRTFRPALLLLTAVMFPAATGFTQPASPARRDSVYQRFLDLPSLAKGGTVQPRWMADSVRFWYVDSAPDRTVIQLVDPIAGRRAPLVDVGRARAAVGRALGHQPPYSGLPGSGFALVDQERGLRFSLEGRDWVLDLASYSVRSVPVPSAAERDRREPRLVERAWPTTGTDLRELASPDGRWLASHRDGNLWLRSTADGRDQQLTSDAVTDFGWTVAGAKWSPDGLRLAALKIDNRGLAKLPILHWLKPTEEVEWRPFTKVGGAMARFEIHVIDILSGRTVTTRFADSVDAYLSPIGWTPDNAEFLFYRMTRDMKRLELAAIRPATGQTRVVLAETQPTFIKNIAANPGWRDLVTLLPDGKRFVLISERDGWDHLYLYDLEGTLIRRLTSGRFPVLKVVTVDIKGGWIYFTGHAEPRPYDTHLYRVALDGSGFKRLTEGTGIHTAAFTPSMRHFVEHHSSIDRPWTAELRAADGRLVMTLATANTDSLRAFGWRPPEEFVAKAADGTTDLHGVLIKPFDFDSTRKYPIVEYIYGGPQTTTVVRNFGQAWVKEQALAQLGFVAVVVDARGTPERGKAFQDVVYRNFGRNEILDHAAVLKQLGARHPWLDLTRVGILGGSWGGYMTIRALVLAPETYHVGIATFPVGELYDHAASAIEPYMGLVETNRAGYDYGSSLRIIDRLRGKLMLLHGTSDVNATFSATMKVVDALTKAGKPYDLRVFPELNHSLTGIEGYFAETVRRYFVEHLDP